MDTLTEPPTHPARALRRMRRIAGGVLAGMAALFVTAVLLRNQGTAFGWLEAFAGAGLAGGLADWFAVTALFRRPLGLPIPHTAIIPRNRARIGKALGDFIAHQLLSPELVGRALDRFDAAGTVPDILRAAPRDELESAVRQLLRSGLGGVAAAPAAGELIQRLWTPERSAELAGQAVSAVSQALAGRRDALRDELAAQGAGWTPKWIDRMLADRVLGGVERLLGDLAAADHPWRLELDRVVAQFAERLAHDPDLAARGEQWKGEVLTDEALERIATDIVDGLLALEIAPEAAEGLNAAVRAALSDRILAQRPAVAQLVSDRLAEWDERELVAALELQTGRDLQFIRINGALVGAVAGLVIHAVTLLLAGR